MSDLLGSILGSMEKPPVNAEKKKVREQKAMLEKMQQNEKEKLSKFRAQIQQRIGDFAKDSEQHKYKFETMDQVCRAIVHEVADVAGLVSFSFGLEEQDRCVIIWKKEYAPSDDEFAALRAGEDWDPEKAARLKAAKQEEEASRIESRGKRKVQEPVPNDYHLKYQHLLGKEAAKDAARVTSANKSYGFVPSENKRDLRTIEQVMADNKARKRQKMADGDTPSATSSNGCD